MTRRALLTGSLADYLMPTASDFPSIRSIALELKPTPHNPLGAGRGRGGIIPVGGSSRMWSQRRSALPASNRAAAVAAAAVAAHSPRASYPGAAGDLTALAPASQSSPPRPRPFHR
jgi:hypothetical protein